MPKEPSSSDDRDAESSGSGATSDALAVLNVIDEMRVGRARVEKNRITVPYTLLQGGKTDSIDLVFSYEEDVFTPGNPTDENIADMIGAQLALNYGLFTPRIVFEGSFDGPRLTKRTRTGTLHAEVTAMTTLTASQARARIASGNRRINNNAREKQNSAGTRNNNGLKKGLPPWPAGARLPCCRSTYQP